MFPIPSEYSDKNEQCNFKNLDDLPGVKHSLTGRFSIQEICKKRTTNPSVLAGPNIEKVLLPHYHWPSKLIKAE
jgi:hypothetical protein